MNPLLHYLRHGDNEGRRPVWHFDSAWYRAAYDLPPDAAALAHFLTQRTSGRFAPMPELYAVLHMPPYRDDPASGEDPFAHYLDDILQQGGDPFPDLQVVTDIGPDGSQLLSDQRHRRARGGARSGRAFLPLRLAGVTQAEYLFRYALVSA